MSTVAPPLSRGRFVVLDGVRGVAAILVMLLHYLEPALTSALSNTWLAVDLFFLLSGFVLSHAYGSGLERGKVSLREFLSKRFVRLYPLYFIGLALGTIASWKSARNLLPASIGILLIPDFLHGKMFPLNSPSWSLWAELLANVAFALLMPLKNGFRALFLVGCLGLGAAILWNTPYLVGGGTVSSWYIGLERAFFSFPLGILLHRLFRQRSIVSINGWFIVAAAALALLVPYSWGNASCLELVYVIVVFPLIVTGGAGAYASGFSLMLFSWLGEISYALYMIHVPMLDFCNRALGQHRPVTIALGIGLSLALAHVLTRHVEPPLRALATRALLGNRRARANP